MSNITRRRFIQSSAAGAAAIATTSVLSGTNTFAAGPNETINLGFIGCGGRAGGHLARFSKMDGVNVAAVCDPDERRLSAAQKTYKTDKAWKDLRHLIDDDDIDAVVISTCNHWHCLAAVWAMQAGKDVYVEKPLSHSQWEGKQVVNAARKYKRICQVGTQQRSDPMQAKIKKFLHEEKALGKITSARCNRYGLRRSIGKRTTPLDIPKTVDYNLWAGPAEQQAIMRDKLQYDWHWDWNTGSGEMGNWGVHILDDLRNNVFQDKVAYPKRICGGGGRVFWCDAGNTPNVHFVWFDTGDIPVVIGLSNLAADPKGRKPPKHPGPASGYIAYCEGGRLEGQRGRAVAYDNDGKVIKTFSGNTGEGLHHKNFIDAMRASDRTILNAEAQVGHESTGWCNLANIAYRMGKPCTSEAISKATQENEPFETLVGAMKSHLADYKVDLESTDIKLSSILEFDTKTEQFTGDFSADANSFLKRKYREGFVVPEIQA